MYFGYNTNGLVHHRLSDALELVAQNGFTGLGITIDNGLLDYKLDKSAYNNQVELLNQWAQTKRFRYVIETGARFLLNPFVKHEPTLVTASSEGRKQRLEFYRTAFQTAAAIKANCISIWSGIKRDDAPDSHVMRRLIEGLKPILDWSQQYDIRIAFEPEPGMFIGNMQDFIRLTDALNGDSRLFLTIDIGHLVCNRESVSQAILQWKDRIINIHLDDMKPEIHQHLPFGTGAVNFEEVFSSLHAINYDSGVFVELSRDSYRAVEVVEQSARFLERFTDF